MSMNSMRNSLHNSPIWKIGLILVALAMVAAAWAGLGSNNPLRNNTNASTHSPDTVIATVNGDPIYRAEFNQAESQQQQRTGGQPVPPMEAHFMHAAALQGLIDQRLFLEEAKRRGYTASDQEVSDYRRKAVVMTGLAAKLGLKPDATNDEIDSALATNGQKSLSQMFTDDQIKTAVLFNKLQTAETNAVVLSPSDAERTFTQWHTRHILIGNATRPDAEALTRATQILAKAKASGADFAALAREYTDDTATKKSGGDDGWISSTTHYVPEFMDAVYHLQKGQISGIVKSPSYGYFIIQLVDSKVVGLPKDFNAKRQTYLDQIKQQEAQTRLLALQTKLRAANNSIDVTDSELNADRDLSNYEQGQGQHMSVLLTQAVTGYQAALKSGSNSASSDVAEINASLGDAYQLLNNKPAAVLAFKAAADASQDPQIYLTVGRLYTDLKKPSDALTAYQAASGFAYTDQSVHMELESTFAQLKRPELVTKEQAWLSNYKKQQALTAAASGPAGMQFAPGGGVQASNIKVAGGSVTSKPIEVHTTSAPKGSH